MRANICLQRLHITCSDPLRPPLTGRRKGANRLFFLILTEEDFDRPASSTQAFYRRPFLCVTFKRRGPRSTQGRGGTTHCQELRRREEDKSNGSPPATLQGLHLFCHGPRPPPHRGPVGHPDLPRHPLQRPERRWAPRKRRRRRRRRRVVAEHQADTSRDKMVG